MTDRVARRYDLENRLRRDAAFPPLLVRAAIPFGTTEGDEHIRGIQKDSVQTSLDHRDPAKLYRVDGQRESIAFGIDYFVFGPNRGYGAHANHPAFARRGAGLILGSFIFTAFTRRSIASEG